MSDRKRVLDFGRCERQPTEKQLALIQEIEYYTGVKFIGYTQTEASEYISDMIEEYEFYKGGKNDF